MAELRLWMTDDDDQIDRLNEITWLVTLKDFFSGRKSNLTHFFRPELIDWARGCIDCSLPPDIWADRMHHIQVADDYRAKVHKLRTELEVLHDEVQTRDENTDQAREQVEAIYTENLRQRDKLISTLEDQTVVLEATNESLRGDVRMARERLGILEGVATTNNLKISSYQQEILELKARLWDALMEDMPE